MKLKAFSHIHIVRKLDEKDYDSDVNQFACYVSDWASKHHVKWTVDGNESEKDLPQARILFIAIGGDGTMLYTMKKSLNYQQSTVIGINKGSLGFLVEDIETGYGIWNFLDEVYDGDTIIDERMVLSSVLPIPGMRGHQQRLAVNEFLFSTGTHNAPFNYKVLINDQVVAEQFGSGVLVSTSTGSTAMALSAGGAIVAPATNIIQVVPLVSHSLSARPFITTGRDVISIETTATERASDFELRADGRKIWENTPSNDGTYRFSFGKYPQQVHIHRPRDWNFFEVLTKKLKW